MCYGTGGAGNNKTMVEMTTTAVICFTLVGAIGIGILAYHIVKEWRRCEWTMGEVHAHAQAGCTKRTHLGVYDYCPDCGKKIEIR